MVSRKWLPLVKRSLKNNEDTPKFWHPHLSTTGQTLLMLPFDKQDGGSFLFPLPKNKKNVFISASCNSFYKKNQKRAQVRDSFCLENILISIMKYSVLKISDQCLENIMKNSM